MPTMIDEFVFIINEDGSITRNHPPFSSTPTHPGDYSSRPCIMKFFTSSDEAKCGDTVRVSWAIQNAEEVTITLNQGEYTASETMPVEGKFSLRSNLSSDDIDITISARNRIGIVSSRKTIQMSKRENTVQSNIGANIVFIIFGLLVLIKIITLFV